MDVLGAFGVSALLREYLIIANFNIWTVREIERRINEKRAGSNKLGVVEIGLPSHHVELLEAVYNSFNAKRQLLDETIHSNKMTSFIIFRIRKVKKCFFLSTKTYVQTLKGMNVPSIIQNSFF
uniref:Uncharacterized protein n=1 Tax=Rhizophagus irregularis (strain DAOM 181602 / DAOM 197198 / MUCL 43194) TaxID=747089 RepID=U9TUD8_RHIID